MTARIIETNDTPLKKVDVEGVTADIIENALKNARIEMDAVLFRTAMSSSPTIRTCVTRLYLTCLTGWC